MTCGPSCNGRRCCNYYCDYLEIERCRYFTSRHEHDPTIFFIRFRKAKCVNLSVGEFFSPDNNYCQTIVAASDGNLNNPIIHRLVKEKQCLAVSQVRRFNYRQYANPRRTNLVFEMNKDKKINDNNRNNSRRTAKIYIYLFTKTK